MQIFIVAQIGSHDSNLQVAEGGWVEGERGERTPFEASLLLSLDHPGRIVTDEVDHNQVDLMYILSWFRYCKSLGCLPEPQLCSGRYQISNIFASK